MLIAAPMRAKEYTINPIKARSRNPMTVVASMSCRASAGSSTGVLPRRTMWSGPRTAAAGLVGMIWPIAIQSNRWRSAARRCFAVGADRARHNFLDLGGNVNALDVAELRHALRREPVEKLRRRARVGAARVCVANLGSEEFEEAIGSTGAGSGDKGGGV